MGYIPLFTRLHTSQVVSRISSINSTAAYAYWTPPLDLTAKNLEKLARVEALDVMDERLNVEGQQFFEMSTWKMGVNLVSSPKAT